MPCFTGMIDSGIWYTWLEIMRRGAATVWVVEGKTIYMGKVGFMLSRDFCRLFLIGLFVLKSGTVWSAGVVSESIVDLPMPKLPVPSGFVAVPAGQPEQRVESAKTGRILVRFVPTGEYKRYLESRVLPDSMFEVALSAFADSAGESMPEDFRRIKQLLESEYFRQQTEELLHSRYGSRGRAVTVTGLYELPENVVGYVITEPVSVLPADSGSRVRVVCEVLLDKHLLQVEYISRQDKVSEAVQRAKRYIVKLTGSEGRKMLPGIFTSGLMVARRFDSADYSGFSSFRFQLEYPASWDIKYTQERGRLLELQPKPVAAGYTASVVLSTLLLPFAPAELEPEAFTEIIRSIFSQLRQKSNVYKATTLPLGGYQAFVQEFSRGMLAGTGEARFWRRIVTVSEGNMLLNISLNLDFTADLTEDAMVQAITALEKEQEKIATGVVFMRK